MGLATVADHLVPCAQRATVYDVLDAKIHSWIYCFRLLERAAGLLKAWTPLTWPRVGQDGENGSSEYRALALEMMGVLPARFPGLVAVFT